MSWLSTSMVAQMLGIVLAATAIGVVAGGGQATSVGDFFIGLSGASDFGVFAAVMWYATSGIRKK